MAEKELLAIEKGPVKVLQAAGAVADLCDVGRGCFDLGRAGGRLIVAS